MSNKAASSATNFPQAFPWQVVTSLWQVAEGRAIFANYEACSERGAKPGDVLLARDLPGGLTLVQRNQARG